MTSLNVPVQYSSQSPHGVCTSESRGPAELNTARPHPSRVVPTTALESDACKHPAKSASSQPFALSGHQDLYSRYIDSCAPTTKSRKHLSVLRKRCSSEQRKISNSMVQVSTYRTYRIDMRCMHAWSVCLGVHIYIILVHGTRHP